VSGVSGQYQWKNFAGVRGRFLPLFFSLRHVGSGRPMEKASFFPSRRGFFFILSIITIFMNGRSLASDSLESMLDYEKMTHAIEVESLRSGNQDPDGENEYVFKLEIIGIAKNLPKKEEKAEEEENEQKKEESTLREVKEELGEIGEIKIKTLSLLKQDEGDEAKKSIKISGDKIREIISKVMNQYGVTEKDTGVSIRIGRFKSEATIIDDNVVTAPLLTAVDEGMTFIKKHINLSYSFGCAYPLLFLCTAWW